VAAAAAVTRTGLSYIPPRSIPHAVQGHVLAGVNDLRHLTTLQQSGAEKNSSEEQIRQEAVRQCQKAAEYTALLTAHQSTETRNISDILSSRTSQIASSYSHQQQQQALQPSYHMPPGWSSDLTGLHSPAQFHSNATCGSCTRRTTHSMANDEDEDDDDEDSLSTTLLPGTTEQLIKTEPTSPAPTTTQYLPSMSPATRYQTYQSTSDMHPVSAADDNIHHLPNVANYFSSPSLLLAARSVSSPPQTPPLQVGFTSSTFDPMTLQVPPPSKLLRLDSGCPAPDWET
jgi:hypothetical protein